MKKLLNRLLHLSKLERIKKMNRNTKLATILIGILIVVGVTTIVLRTEDLQPVAQQQAVEVPEEIETAPAMKATITTIEGTVEYKNELGEWSDAEKDMIIGEETGLRTVGAASRAIITLEDTSVVRIDANTEFLLETLTQNRVVINQKNGYLYNRVVPSNTRTYTVHTENAQFQAVGTAFRTSASGDEEAVEVFENSVRETRNNTTAVEGEKFIAKSENNPDKDKTKEKIDIEKIKEDQFMVWNRQQDQAIPAFKSKLGFLSDFDGPKIEVLEPAAGSGIDLADGATTGTVKIKGKTEQKATLTVQSKSMSGSTPTTVPVADDGTFETPELQAPIGTSVFEFIALDKTGNKTTLTVNYTFKRKVAVQQQGIALTIDESDEDYFVLNWGLVGITTPQGVKVLYGTDENPTFEKNAQSYVEVGATTSIDKDLFAKGKTYYFAVCRYSKDSSSCDTYSNTVSAIIPKE